MDVRRDATASTIREARDLTVSEGRTAVAPVLQDGLLTGDPVAVAAVDEVVRNRLLSERVVRVKVWAADGTILYSDDRAVMGQRFELGPEELEVLETGAAHVERSDLMAPENVGERQFNELLEVYDGLRTPSGQPVLFEAYLRSSSVSGQVNRTVTSVLPALVAGLALLFLIQIPLASRVQRARIEEHRLLRRALEAGEVERRHVAADLHDGVVQSLVGTSLSLSAAAEEASARGCRRWRPGWGRRPPTSARACATCAASSWPSRRPGCTTKVWRRRWATWCRRSLPGASKPGSTSTCRQPMVCALLPRPRRSSSAPPRRPSATPPGTPRRTGSTSTSPPSTAPSGSRCATTASASAPKSSPGARPPATWG